MITISREHPWTSLLTHAHSLAETSQSSVSVFRWSRWTQLADLRTDLLHAHRVSWFPEVLHIIVKSLTNNSQLLLESLHACNHVWRANLWRREQLFQQLYVSQRITRIILVIQSLLGVKTHFGLGVAHNLKAFSALFHEGNQVTMELHVEVCHVCAILSFAATCWMSDSEICWSYLSSAQSQIAAACWKHLEASTRNLHRQSGQAFSLPLKPFILANALRGIRSRRRAVTDWRWTLVSLTFDIMRAWMNEKKVFVWESRASYAVLATCAAPLYLQTLEHLLLVHQLLTDLLELPEHLSHLLCRHVAQPSELPWLTRLRLYPLPEWTTIETTTRQQPNDRNSAPCHDDTIWVWVGVPRSCCLDWTKMTCGSWSVAVHKTKYQVALKITHVPRIVLQNEKYVPKRIMWKSEKKKSNEKTKLSKKSKRRKNQRRETRREKGKERRNKWKQKDKERCLKRKRKILPFNKIKNVKRKNEIKQFSRGNLFLVSNKLIKEKERERNIFTDELFTGFFFWLRNNTFSNNFCKKQQTKKKEKQKQIMKNGKEGQWIEKRASFLRIF